MVQRYVGWNSANEHLAHRHGKNQFAYVDLIDFGIVFQICSILYVLQLSLIMKKVSRKILPPSTAVLDAVSTFKIKKTDHPTMWDLNYRSCSNVSPMIQGKDFDESHSNTAAWESIRILHALSSILGFTIFGLDISNAFQSTPREDFSTTPHLEN